MLQLLVPAWVVLGPNGTCTMCLVVVFSSTAHAAVSGSCTFDCGCKVESRHMHIKCSLHCFWLCRLLHCIIIG
jgi:hypothetical protein